MSSLLSVELVEAALLRLLTSPLSLTSARENAPVHIRLTGFA
jgi:hypothetical protein